MQRRFSFEAGGQTIHVSLAESDVPDYALPDPLLSPSGAPIRRSDWPTQREQLLDLFRGHVYGRTPAPTTPILATTCVTRGVLGGAADRIQIRFDPTGAKRSTAELLVYVPAARAAPVGAILGLNFFGNHTLCDDPGIWLSRAWMPATEDRGIVDHRATDASRGSVASRWPVADIVARGFALATAYCGDFDPDFHDGFENGLHAELDPPGPRGAEAWGSIGAWAFGLSRCLDVLASVPQVDASRVGLIGHSRLGKAALWAGAQDDRFAAVISNDSGCGGAALFRRCFGETVAAITALFPHWFCERFSSYALREAELPIDQHQLLSLIAPRPLYVASAEDDLWADPRGEALAAEAAAPVFERLGGPAPRTHLRPGGHDLTTWDWERYLDFASDHLAPAHPV